MSLAIQAISVLPNGLRAPDKKAITATNKLLALMKQHPLVEVVSALDLSKKRVLCNDEKGKLQSVAVSLPTFLDWAEGINEAELANMHNKPDRFKAVMEHLFLISTLLQHGVAVTIIKPTHACLEGVYTRDIGFVIGTKVFQANLVATPRKPEEKIIHGGIKPPEEVSIEGGNVIVDGDTVVLGIGKRTNREAAEWLQQEIGTEKEVRPIFLPDWVLHLDCVFSPIARPNGMPGGAIIHEPGFVNQNDLAFFTKVYGNLFNISKREYANLGANTLALDPHTRIVAGGCPLVVGILRGALHQHVIELALPEIIKGEGYARCSTLPLIRE